MAAVTKKIGGVSRLKVLEKQEMGMGMEGVDGWMACGGDGD